MSDTPKRWWKCVKEGCKVPEQNRHFDDIVKRFWLEREHDESDFIECDESGTPLQENKPMSDRVVVHTKGGKLTPEQAEEIAAMSEASELPDGNFELPDHLRADAVPAAPASGPGESPKFGYKRCTSEKHRACATELLNMQADPAQEPESQFGNVIEKYFPAAPSPALPSLDEDGAWRLLFMAREKRIDELQAALAEARRDKAEVRENALAIIKAKDEQIVKAVRQVSFLWDIAAVRQLAERNTKLETIRKCYRKLYPQMKRERDAAREELAKANRRNDDMHVIVRSDYWSWMDDGNDHPESLANGTKVIVKGEVMRRMAAAESQLATLKAASDAELDGLLNTLIAQTERRFHGLRHYQDEAINAIRAHVALWASRNLDLANKNDDLRHELAAALRKGVSDGKPRSNRAADCIGREVRPYEH